MKTKFYYALPFVALLAACSENVASETTPAATAAAVPASKVVPAKAAPAAPVPAPETWTIGAVDRVVPVDFEPAAYLIYTKGNLVFRVEFYASDIVRIQAAKDAEFDDPLNDPTAAQILVEDMPVLRDA